MSIKLIIVVAYPDRSAVYDPELLRAFHQDPTFIKA